MDSFFLLLVRWSGWCEKSLHAYICVYLESNSLFHWDMENRNTHAGFKMQTKPFLKNYFCPQVFSFDVWIHPEGILLQCGVLWLPVCGVLKLCGSRWWKHILQRRIDKVFEVWEERLQTQRWAAAGTSGILLFSSWVIWDARRKCRNNKRPLQARRRAEIYLLRHRRWYALKKVDLMNHEIVRLTRWRGSSPHWWFVGVSQRESAKSSSRLSSSKPWIRCYLAWLRRTQQTWNRVWCTADKKGLSERLIRFRKRDPLEAEESHLCNIHKCTSTFFLRWMNPVYVFSGF